MTREEQEAKRAKRKADSPNFEFDSGQNNKRVLGYKYVQDLFQSGLDKLYDKQVTRVRQKWDIHERGLAKKLLDIYGPELTEKAVLYFFENWNVLVKNSGGKLWGSPSIRLLWSMRESIFSNAELGRNIEKRSKKDNAEYVPRDKDTIFGWGD